jgi:hypothetical protein
MSGMRSFGYTIVNYCESANGHCAAVETATHHVLKEGMQRNFPRAFIFETANGRITRMQAYEPYWPHGIVGVFLWFAPHQQVLEKVTSLTGKRKDVINMVHHWCLAGPWPRTDRASARSGDRVAASLRTPSQLDDLAVVRRDRLWVRQLDVTDNVQVGRVVEEAFTNHGRIDVVVPNAGFGVFGAAEDLTTAQSAPTLKAHASLMTIRLALPAPSGFAFLQGDPGHLKGRMVSKTFNILEPLVCS